MPSRVALGFAAGACVNFYPTFGFGVPIALFVAGIVGGTVPAGLLGDLIFKPLFPLMFYMDLWVGNKLLGKGVHGLKRTLIGLVKMHWPAFVIAGKSFLIGAIVNTLIFGGILFLLVYWAFSTHRRSLINLMRRQTWW